VEFTAFLEDLGRRAAAARDGGGGPGPWTRNLMVLRRVVSTNELGRRILDELGKERVPLPPAALVAWEQLDGRGRHGARWESPPGRGAYLSLLRPVADPAELPTLPLLAPVAVARAVDRFAGAGRCRIKWPNDLLVDGRKIAGVLLAAITGRPGEEPTGGAVIGFGVNHGQTADELAGLAPRGATSLALESGRDGDLPPLDAFAWSVLEAVAAELAVAGDGKLAARRYQELSIHRSGERLRCRSADGTLEGIFHGFDPRGFLRLELTSPSAGRRVGEEVLVTAGEVVAP
jgi:BirA family biotin operon repressor/biotin-[acetyl-CoA-carboxylase] ligase